MRRIWGKRFPVGYEIVRYRPEFRDGVLKLLESLWGANPDLNAACLEWKYQRNPYQSEPLLYLALDRGRAVGMRGFCGAKWVVGVGQEEFCIPMACDLVVAPDHRNRGLISKIMRFALDDLRKRGTEYVFNMSASPITFMNSLAMGWRGIGTLEKAIRENARETPRERLKRFLERWPSIFSLAKSIKNQPLVRLAAHSIKNQPPMRRSAHFTTSSSSAMEHPFSQLDENFHASKGPNSSGIFLQKSPRPEAMADLVQRLGNNGRIRHIRDRRYLAWRFQYPLSAYRFLYWGESKLEGYLALEASVFPPRSRHSEVIISDWEAADDRVFGALLKKAIRFGQFSEMVAWKKAVPGPARKVLDDFGFRPQEAPAMMLQHRPTVLVRATGDNTDSEDWRLAGERLIDASRWDVRRIYAL